MSHAKSKLVQRISNMRERRCLYEIQNIAVNRQRAELEDTADGAILFTSRHRPADLS